jgi:hypothetical protein
VSIKLGANGRIVFSAFLGPHSSYPEDSEERHMAFSRSVQSEFDRMQFAHPKGFATLLVRAVNTDYRPWEHWPKEARGNPDKYFRLVIGCSWAEARQVVIGQGGEEGMQWVRVIDGALQEWEATHRKHGGDRSKVCDTHVEEDGHCARGIRRRIQKRAMAGDDQAQAIVAQLATGELSPNAAAIAAGMREKYIRISPLPSKAAKSLAAKQSRRWCLQLLDELSALVFED